MEPPDAEVRHSAASAASQSAHYVASRQRLPVADVVVEGSPMEPALLAGQRPKYAKVEAIIPSGLETNSCKKSEYRQGNQHCSHFMGSLVPW